MQAGTQDASEALALPHSSVLPGDSASQGTGVDVDVVGLTGAVMRPFELFLSTNPGITYDQFVAQYDRCMAGLSGVLSAVFPGSSPPVGVPEPAAGPSAVATSSRTSSRRRRRAARRADRRRRRRASNSASLVSSVEESGSSVSGYLSVPGEREPVLTRGFCYLTLMHSRESRVARSRLGPSPTVAKLLAIPSSWVDVSRLSSCGMARSVDGEWHVSVRFDDLSPSVSTVLRRFMEDVMVSIDFSESRWVGTLAALLLTYPRAVGSFEVPGCDDRVGAGSVGLFAEANFSSLPADLLPCVRRLEESHVGPREGHAYGLLFRMYLDAAPLFASMASEVGEGELGSVVMSLAPRVSLAVESAGGLGLFSRYADPVLALVRFTRGEPELAALYLAAGALAGSVVRGWAGQILPVFEERQSVVGMDRESLRSCSKLVVQFYSLIKILVGRLGASRMGDECREVDSGLRDLFESVLEPSDTLSWVCSGASFRQFAPYRVPLDSELLRRAFFGQSVSEAISVALAGLTVVVVPAWCRGLACVGNYFASSEEAAEGCAAAAGLPRSAVSAEFRSVASAVYFCDFGRREGPDYICALLSKVRVCLYVVAPYRDSVFGEFLTSIWGAKYCAPHMLV